MPQIVCRATCSTPATEPIHPVTGRYDPGFRQQALRTVCVHTACPSVGLLDAAVRWTASPRRRTPGAVRRPGAPEEQTDPLAGCAPAAIGENFMASDHPVAQDTPQGRNAPRGKRGCVRAGHAPAHRANNKEERTMVAICATFAQHPGQQRSPKGNTDPHFRQKKRGFKGALRVGREFGVPSGCHSATRPRCDAMTP